MASFPKKVFGVVALQQTVKKIATTLETLFNDGSAAMAYQDGEEEATTVGAELTSIRARLDALEESS